ncbi:hypothetical protein, partial [Methylophaga sulfidovorans]|uniref:hypothetical protein n=1 Tax=Methylophaga sulfidovorans TaxID=45496 RepID=UPI001C434038
EFPCESRSLPGFNIIEKPDSNESGFFIACQVYTETFLSVLTPHMTANGSCIDGIRPSLSRKSTS